MGLLASVGADVPCLMLQTMESLIAEGTFVGPRHFALPLLGVGKVAIVQGLR